jgi:hypothetical protein
MKNQLIATFAFLSILTTGGLALAGQPSPNAAEGSANAGQGKENAGKPSPRAAERLNNSAKKGQGNPKVQIAHCGCNYDGSGLEWKHISVSTKAKGHLNHTVDSQVTCINDLEEEVTYTRGYADCRISDGEPSNNIGGLLDCEPVPDVSTSCEAEEEPEVPEVPEVPGI